MTPSKLLAFLALVVLALGPVVAAPAASASAPDRSVTAKHPGDAGDRADEAPGTAGMPRDRLTALSLASIGLTGFTLALLFLQDRRRRAAETTPTT